MSSEVNSAYGLRGTSVSNAGLTGDHERLMKEADSAPTMLARERVLKHQTTEQAARTCGMSVTRFERLEGGVSSQPPTPAEAVALRKYAPGLTPDEILSDNTVELRHKVRF
jgi:hypothetical protein